MAKVWTLPLNNGHTMPAFGLGTFLSKPGEVGAAVEAAIKAGYRHIDCAHLYGNEAEIGGALQKCFNEGVVKREDLFITSKLWCDDHARDAVVPACQLTLKNLQLDYLDLYLIHAPWSIHQDAKKDSSRKPEHLLGYREDNIAEVWKGMEEVVAKGLSHAIGISNFTITKTENLLKTAKIVPAVNQVECHPYLQQQKLKEYCDSKGIVFEAYSPLGAPARPGFIRSERADPVVMEEPVIKDIAEKYKATPAQVCIAFALHRGTVVIPKTVNVGRISENFKGTEVKLTDDDMERISGVDKNHRLFFMQLMTRDFEYNKAWDVKEDEQYTVIKKS